MRAFIALDLPREVINEMKNIEKLLKKKNLFSGKFTEPENLHLTLKFLGEIDEGKNGPDESGSNQIEEVKKRLASIKFKEFSVEIGEVGVFSKGFIKIIWIKLNGKGIWDLQKQIDEKLADLFEVEERFMSHITIVRVKNVPDKKQLLDYLKSIKPSKLGFKVNKFFLKKSELKPLGPEYTDVREYIANQ